MLKIPTLPKINMSEFDILTFTELFIDHFNISITTKFQRLHFKKIQEKIECEGDFWGIATKFRVGNVIVCIFEI